jgi:hypothetical protein
MLRAVLIAAVQSCAVSRTVYYSLAQRGRAWGVSGVS